MTFDLFRLIINYGFFPFNRIFSEPLKLVTEDLQTEDV